MRECGFVAVFLAVSFAYGQESQVSKARSDLNELHVPPAWRDGDWWEIAVYRYPYGGSSVPAPESNDSSMRLRRLIPQCIYRFRVMEGIEPTHKECRMEVEVAYSPWSQRIALLDFNGEGALFSISVVEITTKTGQRHPVRSGPAASGILEELSPLLYPEIRRVREFVGKPRAHGTRIVALDVLVNGPDGKLLGRQTWEAGLPWCKEETTYDANGLEKTKSFLIRYSCGGVEKEIPIIVP